MSAKETGYKWSKFFWDDWRNDGALQSCDLATKGFWMDLLSLMFSSERQGYLQINHQPMSLLYISKKTGVDKRTIEKKLKVLIENNVCAVDENGIIFSRRMARETCKSNASVQEASSKDTVSVQEGSRKVPVNLQEEIAENSQKSDALNKNRIDKNRKEYSNPPKSPLSQNQKIDPDVIDECVNDLVQVTKLKIEQCRKFVDEWLLILGGSKEALRSCVDRGLTGKYPINYTASIVKNYEKAQSSNVTFFPGQSNKDRLTQEMGLCRSMAEFEALYPQEEIPENYKTWGAGY